MIKAHKNPRVLERYPSSSIENLSYSHPQKLFPRGKQAHLQELRTLKEYQKIKKLPCRILNKQDTLAILHNS